MKKTIREPAVLFMIFLFPIIFVFAFGTAFSGGEQPTYKIGIVNNDQGNSVNASQTLLMAMSDTKILSLQRYAENSTAQNDLAQGNIQAVIIIPSDFSQSFSTYQATPNDPTAWRNITIALYIDKGFDFQLKRTCGCLLVLTYQRCQNLLDYWRNGLSSYERTFVNI